MKSWHAALILSGVAAAALLFKFWGEGLDRRPTVAPGPDSVDMVAHVDEAACGPDHVLVKVSNHSDGVLKRVGFHLAIFRTGDSRDLGSAERSEWTRVVRSRGSAEACDGIQHLPGGAYFFRVEGKDAAFYEQGEFIPN